LKLHDILYVWPEIFVVNPVRKQGFLSDGVNGTEKSCGFLKTLFAAAV